MPADTPTPRPPVVDVAVGVLQRKDGRVLLAQRPAGKAVAGYWEFPGGKVEASEDRLAGLKRELHEELGVAVTEAWPWLYREHTYPHLTARLHLYRVTGWRGEPHGREGQPLSWQRPRAVSVEPLLPANHSIMQALALPPVYAITQAADHGVSDFLERLRGALDRGVRLIQVRERKLSAADLKAFTNAVVRMAQTCDAQVLINADEKLCHETDAAGVHLTAAQLMQRDTRPDVPLCAASCHNREELLRAAALGVDFAVLSPVLPTLSHPGEPTLGWERFAALCKDLSIPVYALGGMQHDHLTTAMAHNAHGVAMLRGAWD